MNLIYNPDHQQVLDHHKELLKKAEEERFARRIMAAPKQPPLSFRKQLRLLISNRRADKTVPTASRTSSAHP